MTVPVMFHGNSVTFYVHNRPYMADSSVPGYEKLLAELKLPNPDKAKLIALTEPARAIAAAVEAVPEKYMAPGVVSVTRTAVYYNGKPLSGVLIDRILSLLDEGYDFMPMVRFLENLFSNPAEYARDECYLWLEKSDLPITEDGCFLAYKRVNRDYTSIHDNFTKNNPGLTVQMPREQVDTVRAHECSTGLHFCSKEYLTHGPSGIGVGYVGEGLDGARIVLLKVNPADVVAIPKDYANTKGRAWRYEVLEDVTEAQFNGKWSSVATSTGKAAIPPAPEVPAPEMVKFPSDLSKALYAAIGEVVSTADRSARLAWTNNNLPKGRNVTSFNELNVDEAALLIEAARAQKAVHDARTAEKLKRAGIAAIESYGIEKLRAEASHAGLKGAWKLYKKAELRAYLFDKLIYKL